MIWSHKVLQKQILITFTLLWLATITFAQPKQGKTFIRQGYVNAFSGRSYEVTVLTFVSDSTYVLNTFTDGHKTDRQHYHQWPHEVDSSKIAKEGRFYILSPCLADPDCERWLVRIKNRKVVFYAQFIGRRSSEAYRRVAVYRLKKRI